MKWTLTSYNTQTSGEYAVVKQETPRLYFAWQGKGTSANYLGAFDNADAAKAACEQHAQQ